MDGGVLPPSAGRRLPRGLRGGDTGCRRRMLNDVVDDGEEGVLERDSVAMDPADRWQREDVGRKGGTLRSPALAEAKLAAVAVAGLNPAKDRELFNCGYVCQIL